MVKGRRSLGVVWRESCHNWVLGEVELVVQKFVATARWLPLRSWNGDVLRAWDRPFTELHASWWLAIATAYAKTARNIFWLLRYRCSLLRRESEPAEKQT